MKKYNLSLMIFRRDLRIYDNTALIHAIKESKKIIPCFIFDPRQVKQNPYKSNNAIQFMIESLKNLEKQLAKKRATLFLFYGISENVVKKMIKNTPIDAIFINKDYTPFSINRDEAIEKEAHKAGVDFHSFHDELLHDPTSIMTGSGTPYAVFTPFYKKSLSYKIKKPQKAGSLSCYKGSIPSMKSKKIYGSILKKKNPFIQVHGGTDKGKSILRKIKRFKNYSKTRDFPAISTTNLSAYLKFGCLSIRQTYHTIVRNLSSSDALTRQLVWRDFWTYVAYHSPFVYGQAYHQKYNKLFWSKSKKNFERWCKGQTGFPIVDAGIRQLNTTGFMHNRARMITASFLTKDLHLNWMWGEKFFAQQLVDYDPAVNNGNWQWVASVGCDAQPYFRIFNPWLQQKKYDPDCIFIKRWIPELQEIPNKSIHNWYKKEARPPNIDYPAPMVNHDIEKKKTIEMYKKV